MPPDEPEGTTVSSDGRTWRVCDIEDAAAFDNDDGVSGTDAAAAAEDDDDDDEHANPERRGDEDDGDGDGDGDAQGYTKAAPLLRGEDVYPLHGTCHGDA